MPTKEMNTLVISTNEYEIVDSTARSTIATKQDTLVSGTNIKTVNNESLLGSGNIDIEGGSEYTAGDGINITSSSAGDVIENTAGMYLGDDTSPATALIDADLLGGQASSYYQPKLQKITNTSATTSTISNMATDTLYVYTQPLTSLTITAVEDGPTGIIFKSGSTATNVTLPSTVITPSDYEIKENKTYEFNIMNNLLVVGEW